MRLAQRVPVRIHIDEVPEGVKLVAGLTATVQIEPFAAPPVAAPAKVGKAEAELATYEPEAQPKPQPPAAANPAPDRDARWPLRRKRRVNRRPPRRRKLRPPPRSRPQQQPAPPAAGAGGLDVSAPPSAAASNAAAAASADLKTLEQQIATNPPSGAASPSAANPGSSATFIPPSEYLGQTFDLESGQSVTPEPRRRSPELDPPPRPLEVAA